MAISEKIIKDGGARRDPDSNASTNNEAAITFAAVVVAKSGPGRVEHIWFPATSQKAER